MSIAEALDLHRDGCSACRSGFWCAVAIELIDRLTDKLMPPVPTVARRREQKT